jgi:hypothetical protein
LIATTFKVGTLSNVTGTKSLHLTILVISSLEANNQAMLK